ncbi:MAG: glycosyltransferase family 2 protein [Candidatus Nanohalarchaeota archaeon]|nr:MAG: glycosyltransferase family 2 protein [Candidatus Nanohaloarchaeota archaeon]
MMSVVIPTYNEEKNIEKCLKSLLNQTLPKREYEIIVVDGESKDNTVKIAKRYADKVINQKSKGVGGARNDGVGVSNGDIIATTDADCIVPMNWLERVKSNFEDRSIVMLYGPFKPLEDCLKNRVLLKISEVIMYTLYKSHIFYATLGANCAIRKEVFISVGKYKELPAADDYELAIRIKRLGKIKYDKSLHLKFSLRRMKKIGIIQTVYECVLYPIKLIFHADIKCKNYNKFDY